MNKQSIIVWRGKYGDYYIDNSTNNDDIFSENALKHLYEKIKECRYWEHIADETEQNLYNAAEEGNMAALKLFLEYRKEYEYENWDLCYLITFDEEENAVS